MMKNIVVSVVAACLGVLNLSSSCWGGDRRGNATPPKAIAGLARSAVRLEKAGSRVAPSGGLPVEINPGNDYAVEILSQIGQLKESVSSGQVPLDTGARFDGRALQRQLDSEV